MVLLRLTNICRVPKSEAVAMDLGMDASIRRILAFFECKGVHVTREVASTLRMTNRPANAHDNIHERNTVQHWRVTIAAVSARALGATQHSGQACVNSNTSSC